MPDAVDPRRVTIRGGYGEQTDSMTRSAPVEAAIAEGPRLRATQGLQFKLATVFVLVLVVVALAAYLAGRVLVQSRLVEDTARYQRESGLRLVEDLEHRLQLSQVLAGNLAVLALSGAPATWVERVPALVANSGLDAALAGIGWWPEPRSNNASARASRFWLADGVGALQARDDYNDPRVIAYWQEPWYTPARYAQAGECHWTPVREESLSRRPVAGCTLPVRSAEGYVGAVTVLLDLRSLEQSLARAAQGQSGYALLVDRDNRLMALTGVAANALQGEQRPQNLAELAQRLPAFNPLALDMHRRDEAFLSRAVASPLYAATTVSSLQQATREGSRQDAESALALIWNSAAARDTEPSAVTELALQPDPLLNQNGAAAVFELVRPHWKLIRVTPAREGMAGAQYFFVQTLLVVLGLLSVALLLIFAGIRLWLLRPLAKMADALSDGRATDQSLHVALDASAPSELGVIGHWYNERVRQLREAMDRVMSQQSQLIVEAGERGRADEQALRLRERSHAVMSTVHDAVVVVDARAQIEDMNAAAERLTGMLLRNALGRPCSEVLQLRLANQAGAAPDLAAGIVASVERVEHSDGLFLYSDHRSEREVHLVGVPLRGPGGRTLGAALIFRPREAPTNAPKLVIDRRSVDPITGLPTRAACDRRLRALMDSTRLQPEPHALLVFDIDRLRHINETLGQAAGDEVLVGTAELLVATAPTAEVFRLAGDSFAVLVEQTGAEDARRIGRQVVEAVAARRFRWSEKSLSVTVSGGAVVFDSDAGHPMDLLRHAHEACAAAKLAGRNTFKLRDPSMDPQPAATDEALWVRRIRAGMDQGLLHLTTQPVQPADMHLREGAVFEVSLALEDEEGFWAEPDAFLPVAERNGLAAEVERWALRQTLEHLARNPAVMERMAFCSLSLSPQTVAEGATLELLAQLFQRHPQVPPRQLCLNLRESVLDEVPAAAQAFGEAMRSLGCRVSMDHFAVRGAAEVDLLRRLPADYLRFDARHFMDVGGDAVDQMLADSLVRLARTLQRRVMVVEIGNEAVRDAWKRLGADYLQGLALARPSPVVFSASA